jgi:CO/xanthine dehydrogenase Mo-binding subunit
MFCAGSARVGHPVACRGRRHQLHRTGRPLRQKRQRVEAGFDGDHRRDQLRLDLVKASEMLDQRRQDSAAPVAGWRRLPVLGAVLLFLRTVSPRMNRR